MVIILAMIRKIKRSLKKYVTNIDLNPRDFDENKQDMVESLVEDYTRNKVVHAS